MTGDLLALRSDIADDRVVLARRLEQALSVPAAAGDLADLDAFDAWLIELARA